MHSEILDSSHDQSVEPETVTGDKPAAKSATILVVDDVSANLQVLAGMLKDRGYRVRPVPTGKLALLAARRDPPDLILLDVNMPDMNGYEVCQHLKADETLRGVPVIFVSAHNEDLDKAKAFASGGVDYLTKPFQMEELHARVETHLKLRQLQIELEQTNARLGKANDGLEDSLAYVLGVVDTVREPLLVLGGDLRVQTANRSFYQTFRVSPEETEGRLVYHLGDRQWNIPQLRRLLEEILPQKTSFDDFEVDHEFGMIGRKIMLLNARCFDQIDSQSKLILLAFEDVTERRRVEEERREIETRFTSVVKNIRGHAIFTMDVVGRITSWNMAAERILGYAEADILGQPFSLIFTPEDLLRGIPELELRTAQDIGRAEDERWHIRKGGERFWALGIVTPIRDANARLSGFSKILRDMTERKLAEKELERAHEAAETQVRERTAELRTANAGLQKEIADRNLLEQQLRQAQKMEAFGQLAGGVAHDFNNLLTIISGYSEIMLDSLPPDDRNRGLIKEIHKAGERAAALTRQLLAFSRKQVIQPRVLDLNGVVASTKKMLERLIGDDVNLTTVLAPLVDRVNVDPGQVEQVIVNLVLNARDAMPRGGRITIETANADLDDTYGQSHAEVKPGRYVLLAVSDTGCGMSEEIQRHIFEPFFTTKGPGRGTGLGLATVFGIVKQSGGHVWVYSEVGRGTTFKIYLPAVAEIARENQPEEKPTANLSGSETILLVEDEKALRALTRVALLAKGYTLLEAADGEEALRLCEQHVGPIHLLVSDVVMPHLGGRQLAERLMVLHPEMRVLFISGYTDDAVVRHGVLQAEVAFLQKPFPMNALHRKVRAVLDSPAHGPTSG